MYSSSLPSHWNVCAILSNVCCLAHSLTHSSLTRVFTMYLSDSSDQLCSQLKQENNNPFARPELRQVNERLLSSQNASRIFLGRAIGFLGEYIHRSSSVAHSQVCRGAKPQLHDCDGFNERARNFTMALSSLKVCE